MTGGSQKFIARNRAPRVQIEYDVELYGAEKKVQLPFVMGVISDLAGKSKLPQPAIDDRKFLEIDVDNFDDRMKAMQPRAAFSVPNTLTGEGNLTVDLTFEKMADFSPAEIASKIEPLAALLEARTQLSNLMAYMDGKAGAEALIEKILADPTLLGAISGAATSDADQGAALESLRALAPADTAPKDDTADVLDALREQAPAEAEARDDTGDVLDGLKSNAPPDSTPIDTSADILAGLANQAPVAEDTADTGETVLDALRDAAPAETQPVDDTADILGGLSRQDLPDTPEDTSDATLASLSAAAPDPVEVADEAAAALNSLAATELPQTNEIDPTADTLSALANAAPPEAETRDETADALGSLADVQLPEEDPDTTDDLLADLAANAPDDTAQDDGSDAALDSLADLDLPEEETDTTDDLLADLAADAPDDIEQDDGSDAALDSLADFDLPEEDVDTTDDLLADLAADAPEDSEQDDGSDAALDSLADFDLPEEDVDTTDDLLADLAADAPEDSEQDDGSNAALDSLADFDLPEEEADTTDDLLADLAAEVPEDTEQDDGADAALDSLADLDLPEEETDTTDDLLTDLAADAPDDDVDLDDLLGDLSADTEDTDQGDDGIGDLMADLSGDQPASGNAEEDASVEADPMDTAPETASADAEDLDDLLGGLDSADSPVDAQADTDLDDLLGDLGLEDDSAPDAGDLDDLAGGLDAPDPADAAADDTDLDDLLGDLDLGDDDDQAEDPPATEAAEAPDTTGDDLDDLLGDLGVSEDAEEESEDDGLGDLDDLLGGLDAAAEPDETPVEDAADDLDDLGDLDDLLSDLDADAATADTADAPAAKAVPSGEPEFAYGQMTGDRPDPQRLNRKRFRLAILGDFSGRAAHGQLETGDALAARKAILLDPDTAEEVIESFATELVLPIGKDEAGVEVKLGGLDDLHPDELYEKVGLFSELAGLRSQLSSGATADNAARMLREWGERFGTRAAPTRTKSSGNSVPANLRLSDFQKLIGDTSAKLTQPAPLDEMLARIVGPHIRAVPDADSQAMKAAVDEALSAAMRLILHHPEFQSIEAQWRSIDLIARSVETDDTLDVMLYDISAEEIAADLASSDDLSQSGFVRLLTEEPLDAENGRGGYSAMIGLYGFEETPPHAELLGRIARVAAHVDAPFFASISPAFLEVEKKDRHPLVAKAWDTLRAMPEAGHIGLATPRFLLRRPYGAKSEPIYEFEFEEFTMADGLGGMLWANPVVLVAVLLARSFRENGASMKLGSIMSLGEMPYHFVTDQHGDQVALPCTERNLTLDKVEKVLGRGLMPLVSIKGRDEVRLASFNSLAGAEILGPWTGVAPPEPSPPKPKPPKAAESDADEDIDTDTDTAQEDGGGDDDFDLDDLLADFGDTPGDDDAGDIDADLAALLEDL